MPAMIPPYRLIAIGASAGGIEVLRRLLPAFPREWPTAVVVVLHLHPETESGHIQSFAQICRLPVQEAAEKEAVRPGVIYFAPADYHLLIESDATFSLSTDEKVRFARPSIDVLFESAARSFGPAVVAVLLSGANDDGAHGMKIINQFGGLTVVQEPGSATVRQMPESAIAATDIDHVLPPNNMVELLLRAPLLAPRRK